MVNVLIICSGNSVRSQIAEAYFNFYARGKGLFFSAGIKPAEIHPTAIQVMAEDNIDLREHTSKSVKAFENIPFDHVIIIGQVEPSAFLDHLHYHQSHHIVLENPPQDHYSDEETTLEAYRIARDQLKRNVLRFIGQEFSTNKEPSSLP